MKISAPEILQRPAPQPGAPLFGAPRPERPSAPANPGRRRPAAGPGGSSLRRRRQGLCAPARHGGAVGRGPGRLGNTSLEATREPAAAGRHEPGGGGVCRNVRRARRRPSRQVAVAAESHATAPPPAVTLRERIGALGAGWGSFGGVRVSVGMNGFAKWLCVPVVVAEREDGKGGNGELMELSLLLKGSECISSRRAAAVY